MKFLGFDYEGYNGKYSADIITMTYVNNMIEQEVEFTLDAKNGLWQENGNFICYVQEVNK